MLGWATALSLVPAILRLVNADAAPVLLNGADTDRFLTVSDDPRQFPARVIRQNNVDDFWAKLKAKRGH